MKGLLKIMDDAGAKCFEEAKANITSELLGEFNELNEDCITQLRQLFRRAYMLRRRASFSLEKYKGAYE